MERRYLAALALMLVFGLPGAAFGEDAQSVARGEQIVATNCAPCHAIGKTGASPHPEAPPFRTLSRQYPVELLAESLAEGIMTGHEDMPVFVAQPSQITDIITFLESIQE